MLGKYYDNMESNLVGGVYDSVMKYIETYGPKYLSAILVLLLGALLAFLLYNFIIYLFKKFKILDFIDKLTSTKKEDTSEKDIQGKDQNIIEIKGKKGFSEQVKIDILVAKAVAYYIFLVFFRFSIQMIGITEVEEFMKELLIYLPSLFIAVLIGFFGVRFADSVYNVVYHMVELSNKKTASIVATGAKIIILFFTLMAVLSKIGIAPIITNTILIGFVSMLTLAGGLAFGLGGKEVAKEILESFKKEEK